jgi:hypothetical protein
VPGRERLHGLDEVHALEYVRLVVEQVQQLAGVGDLLRLDVLAVDRAEEALADPVACDGLAECAER